MDNLLLFGEPSLRRLRQLMMRQAGRRFVTTPTSMINRLTGTETWTDPVTAPMNDPIINVTTATLTVTQAAHAGRLLTLNRAAGIAITLPVPTGSLGTYIFMVMTALSGGSHTLTRGTASDAMIGIAGIGKAAGTSTTFQTTTNNTITLNGTTTGGLGGDWIWLMDCAANQWFVNIQGFGSGTLATPFSTT